MPSQWGSGVFRSSRRFYGNRPTRKDLSAGTPMIRTTSTRRHGTIVQPIGGRSAWPSPLQPEALHKTPEALHKT